MPNILAIIPARGGSKGLPKKNIRSLLGHPLLAYSVAAAKQSRLVVRTLCSTDHDQIASAAQQYGAETPFMRPAALAQDDTLDLPVMQHAIQWLQEHEGWKTDILVQLRPTSPIRPRGLVDQAVRLLLADRNATAVRSLCPAPVNPHKMWRCPESGSTQSPYIRNLLDVPGIAEPYNALRQQLPAIWWQTGTVDVVRADVVLGGSMTGGRILPCLVPSEIAVDIDAEADLQRAETMMAQLDCVRLDVPLSWGSVKALVLDVDGTLTPGTMYYGSEGEVLKKFHTHDGHGLSALRQATVHLAIITGESTPIAGARAQKLGIKHIHIGVKDKLPVLQRLATDLGVRLAEICYVGDDFGDVSCLEAVRQAGGVACAVADARPEARAAANWITARKGGEGAVRDVCDKILQARRKI